ncbi:unnamed protein product [Linum tenue]|uniref:TPX2 C-terminal domain-containing protein n=1 Tax=Linum tenue TaxID=586396 RepID=A0AAV0MC66_9ROSI|nr:unnamed protein product [Linum tenue]
MDLRLGNAFGSVMDMDGVLLTDEFEMNHQNGGHEHNAVSGGDDVFYNNMNGATFDHGVETVEGSNVTAEDHDLAVAKEGEGVKDADYSEKAQLVQVPGKSKNEKLSNPRKASGAQLPKGKDFKGVAPPTVANGTAIQNSRAKLPSKAKSFSEKQAQATKLSGKSEAASTESLIKKTTLKPLKKAPMAEADGDRQSSSYPLSGANVLFVVYTCLVGPILNLLPKFYSSLLHELVLNNDRSPTGSDGKPRKTGALPNYGFSFKCDERAEKRREFYTKLEEKIHAKEEEKNNMQAKSKESQEAELRRLRKSLTFKATPMPTFYQEPPPERTELKKIPTTRPKSPKLGRRKSSSPADADGNNMEASGVALGRLSLNAKVSQNTPTPKEVAPALSKKPLRKSLPRLPSQTTKLTRTNGKTGGETKATNDNVKLPSSSAEQEANEVVGPPRAKVSEIEPDEAQELMMAGGEQAQLSVAEQ